MRAKELDHRLLDPAPAAVSRFAGPKTAQGANDEAIQNLFKSGAGHASHF